MPVQVWTPGLGGTVGTTRTTPPGPSSIQTRSDDLEPDKVHPSRPPSHPSRALKRTVERVTSAVLGDRATDRSR